MSEQDSFFGISFDNVTNEPESLFDFQPSDSPLDDSLPPNFFDLYLGITNESSESKSQQQSSGSSNLTMDSLRGDSPPPKHQQKPMSPPLNQFVGSQPASQNNCLINVNIPLANPASQATNIDAGSSMNYNNVASSIQAMNVISSGPSSFFQNCSAINHQQCSCQGFPRKAQNKAKYGDGPEVLKLKKRNPEYNDKRDYRETEVYKKIRTPTKAFFLELGDKYNQEFELQINDKEMDKFGRDQKRNLKCAVLFFQNRLSSISPFLIQNGFKD